MAVCLTHRGARYLDLQAIPPSQGKTFVGEGPVGAPDPIIARFYGLSVDDAWLLTTASDTSQCLFVHTGAMDCA